MNMAGQVQVSNCEKWGQKLATNEEWEEKWGETCIPGMKEKWCDKW